MYKLVLVFMLAFMLSISSMHYFNNFFANQALRRDSDQLLNQFHGILYDAHDVLRRVPEIVSMECNEDSRRILDELTYKNPAIRWLGISTQSDGILCQNSPVDFDIGDYREHRFSNGYTIASSKAENHTNLLLIYTEGEAKFYADLNPPMSGYLEGFDCNGCLEYEIWIKGDPGLRFFTDAFKGSYAVEQTVSRLEKGLDISMTIRGTDEFFNHFLSEGKVGTIIFSLLVSLGMVLLVQFLRSSRQSFERIIRNAIRKKEFVPFYQPIVDSRTGEVAGVEVLARWIRSDGRIVPPGEFIPFAEESGQIVGITASLVQRVGRDLVSFGWRSTGKFASVNIVPEHLVSDELFDLVSEVTCANGLAPGNIALEITERRQIEDLKQARRHLDRFYSKGIELKLDDAGTGYGGFSYVQELGISTLKVDKMFVDSVIDRNDVKTPVLDAIVSFAKSSDLKIIAEGVESLEQVAELNRRGIYVIQGYYYAEPMPASGLIQWLQDRARFDGDAKESHLNVTA